MLFLVTIFIKYVFSPGISGYFCYALADFWLDHEDMIRYFF